MTPAALHAIYGVLPRVGVETTHGAIQLSPLLPPSTHRLESMAEASLSSAVLHAPPSTVERRYVLAQMLRALAVGAPFTALALNDKGGARIAAELKNFGCEVSETSRNHYRICTTARPAHCTNLSEALAAGGPQQHPAHGLWTQAGVFSWDRIDTGSALLLQHLPTLSGHGADLGCGIGVLSRAVLQSPSVTALTLLDCDHRALSAAEKNIHDPRATFVWADIRSHNAPSATLDFVVMNPPFHDHGIEDKSLGQTFIETAARMLKPRGVCWITANRHLPYEALLAKRFTTSRCVADADGFKILVAEK